MPRKYYFYSKLDSTQEPISKTVASSRLKAAKFFAVNKRLPLKKFLSIYSVSR